MKKPAAIAEAPTIAAQLKAHAVRQQGAVPLLITHSTALNFEVDVMREAPVFPSEDAAAIRDNAWHITAHQGQCPHALNAGQSWREDGFEVQISRHFMLYGANAERAPEFKVMIDAGDLRALFIGMDELRKRMQAAGFDV